MLISNNSRSVCLNFGTSLRISGNNELRFGATMKSFSSPKIGNKLPEED